MKFPKPDTAQLLKRLQLPKEGIVDMVLDTDTYNEVDDQFALCYALLSPNRLNVQAVYAAPFHNDRSSGPEDGMEKSYDEILRLLGKMQVRRENFVFKGSPGYLPTGDTPVDSPAARDLIQKAMARPDGASPLYVVAIGAITNVASALLMEPKLVDKICIVWLGGHTLSWPHTQEFNLAQDPLAARVVFDSGAPVVLVPCMGVASHMLASIPELQACIGSKNPICDALVELFSEYTDQPFGWAKEIWDVAPIGYMINPDWAPTVAEPSPLVCNAPRWAYGQPAKYPDDICRWSRDSARHPILVVQSLNRNAIFRHMYKTLSQG